MSWINHRVRVALVDLVALSLLIALILGVYLAKTIAGGERAKIASVDRQIAAEKARIRLLQAENAALERPDRIERLSETYLGMAPVAFKRQVDAEALPDLARKPLALPAKAIEATPDPTVMAPVQPAAPLATTTQVAAR